MHSPSGQQSHGVHLCHKCGWPFPNPHPSSRHRRAHKKICGTIEGYKLVQSGDAGVVSDEDHLSDDDHKTPSPKPVEKINSGKQDGGDSGEAGERSNKSEDEMFSDAVTDLNDTGISAGTQEHLKDARPAESNVEKVTERKLTMYYSFKDNAHADDVENPSNSTDSSSMPNPGVHESTTNLSGSNLESQVHVSSSEEPAPNFSIDNNDVAEAKKNIMVNASFGVAEGSVAYSGQETDSKGNDKVKSDKGMYTLLSSEHADQPSETEPKAQEMQAMTSHSLSADRVVISKEDQDDATAAKMSPGDLAPGVKFLEHVNLIKNDPSNLSAKQELEFDSSVNSIEDYRGEGERNDNVHELSVPADLLVVDHTDIKLEGFKDHRVKLNNSIDAESLEIIKDKKDYVEHPVSLENYTSSQSVQSSEVPKASASDLHVSEDNRMIEKQTTEDTSDVPQIKLTGSEKSDALETPVASVTIDAESLEIIKDKKDDVEHPVSVENYTSSQSVESSEVPKASVSDLHVSEDNSMIEKQSTEGISDVPQINITSNEKLDALKTPVASVTIETKEILPVGTVGKQSPSYVCDDLLHKGFPESAVNALNEVNPMIALEDANAIGVNDAGTNEKAISETIDVVENDENKRVEEEKSAKNGIRITNLCESDNAGELKKGKIENSAVVRVEDREEPVEEELSPTTKPVSECAASLNKLEVVAHDVIDKTTIKLPETDTVSDTKDGAEQIGISGNNKAEEERVAEHDRGVELSERTSEDHMMKVPPVSSFGTESTVQNSVAVDDSHTEDFGRGDSAANLSPQGESIDDNSVKHQLASPADVSVDSLSHTDSLEANWGSISVLSTQSDTPIVDPVTDYPASAEKEKSNMKAKVATEGQHSNKSDVFEAPSFMTLVEPGGGDNHKAAGPQTQLIQNMQQQNAASSQAGWFPSITQVVNDSEGRKKNEEAIAKVTNWSTGKQHIPLKNLLGEAKHETRPKSPNPKENQAHVIEKDGTASKDNGSSVTTVSSILGPEETMRLTGKERDSPTSYPADNKGEKRKDKGRSYWAQFMCCSSVK